MTHVDEEVKKEIVERICEDDKVDASNIKVKVNGGIAELTGSVREEPQRWAAELAAKDNIRVSKVKNYIVVEDDQGDTPRRHVA